MSVHSQPEVRQSQQVWLCGHIGGGGGGGREDQNLDTQGQQGTEPEGRTRDGGYPRMEGCTGVEGRTWVGRRTQDGSQAAPPGAARLPPPRIAVW